MSPEQIKETLAPCGLCCKTCFAHVDGDIHRYSVKLKERLGRFHLNAQRFVTLLENPIFKKYPDFKEMLDYFAKENCQGCRNEPCQLFKACGVRTCIQERQVDFCYQCDRFPCDRTHFDPGLYQGWIAINERIQKDGVEPFARASVTRPRYP